MIHEMLTVLQNCSFEAGSIDLNSGNVSRDVNRLMYLFKKGMKKFTESAFV